MLPSLPRLADQPFISASLKKQWAGFFLGCAALAAASFVVLVSAACPQAASAAAITISDQVLRMSSSPLTPLEPKADEGSSDFERQPIGWPPSSCSNRFAATSAFDDRRTLSPSTSATSPRG